MVFFSCFIVFGIAWILWTAFQVQLKTMLGWIRTAELYLGGLLRGEDHAVAVYNAPAQLIGTWKTWFPKLTPQQTDYETIRVATYVAVLPIRFIFACLLGMMALWCIFFGPGTHYKRRMGLEDLMREQAKSFPAIQPFLNFDPRKLPSRAPGQPVPSQLPLFSEALSPEEWLAYNEIKMQSGQIDIGPAWQALGRQLGRRWQGPRALPMHGQALFAAFALKHARKRKEAELLLNEFSKAWTPEKGLRLPLKVKAEIKKIIKDPKLGGVMQKYADEHGYETTALLRCLQRARQEAGILAPAEFLWLRGHDRNLWYPLNNLGRKSYHAEAAGAMVHFTNELIAGQKIPTPRFEEVIRSFETYMKSGSARPIPELDRKAGGGRK